MTNRRKFFERSVLGVGGALFSSVLLGSCSTDDTVAPDLTSGFPSVSISNNTSSTIMVLLTQGDVNAVPTPMFYEKTLIILGTSNFGQILPPGQTANYPITLSIPDQALIELIIVQPDFYYPITVARIAYDVKSKGYGTIAVTDEDVNNMKQTEKFYRLLKAFPSSAWADNFHDLLTSVSDSSMTKAEINEASQIYFNSLEGYNKVTLQMVSLLGSYYREYINGYADYEVNKTSYLYSSDGNSVMYIGSVNVLINKSNSATTITFTDPQNVSKPLYFFDSFLVDNTYAENPSICLAGGFIIQSRLTNNPDDTAIVPSLMGTVNGVLVFATDQKPAESHNWFYLLLHPKTLWGYIDIFLLIAGAMINIEGFLLAFGLVVVSERDNQSTTDLAKLIEKANEDREARLNSQRGNAIPVDTSIDSIPDFS